MDQTIEDRKLVYNPVRLRGDKCVFYHERPTVLLETRNQPSVPGTPDSGNQPQGNWWWQDC